MQRWFKFDVERHSDRGSGGDAVLRGVDEPRGCVVKFSAKWRELYKNGL